MSIYLFTLIVLLFFSFIELRTSLSSIQHTTMLVFVYSLLVFQVGLRWQTGTDWEPYLEHFEEIKNLSDVYFTVTGFEQGYSLFVLVSKSLWNSYTFFLVLHAIIYHLLVFSAFKKLSPYIFISILVFYATSMGVMGSNRQLIALGICLFAMRYVIAQKTLPFFILVGFAFLFHSSAALFIVYYFLNKDFNQFLIISLLIVAFVVGKTSLPLTVFSFVGNNIGGMGASKAVYYSEAFKEISGTANLSILGLIKRFVFLALFMFNYKLITAQLSYYKLIFNGYIVGLIIYFLFADSILVLVNRGSLYFTAMEALLLSSQFILIKNKHFRVNGLLLLFIICIFLFYQSISGYADLFVPYKGVIINTDVYRYRLQ